MSNRKEREAQHRKRMDKKHARAKALKDEAMLLVERLATAYALLGKTVEPINNRPSRTLNAALLVLVESAEREVNEQKAEEEKRNAEEAKRADTIAATIGDALANAVASTQPAKEVA